MTYADRLDQFLSEGRLIRNAWRNQTPDGRETACLLAAMFPEVRDSVTQCPAGSIPEWWARLTVHIDDAGTDEAWPGIVQRYAALARRWHVLTADDWQRLDYQCRAVAVREARSHCPKDEDQALRVVDAVLALLDRAGRGESDSGEEWRAAEAAAGSAAAARARAAAARAAAARAGAARAARAAWAAAAAAADAAEAAAAWAAADAAARAADDAANDRMADGWMGVIEAACAVREAA